MEPTGHCLRNRDPILNVVKDVFPAEGTILEIASGNGGHVTYLASQLPGLRWQPSEAQEENLPLIQRFIDQENLADRISPPIHIDATTDFSSKLTQQYDGAMAVNLFHIAPFEVVQGFFRGLSGALKPNAAVCVYGPFGFNSTLSPQSNIDFNEMLKSRNPAFGIRDIDDVKREAQLHGFELTEQHPVPSNNYVMVFRKQ